MRTDHTSYQLATRVSIGGLVVQAIVSLTVLLFGLATHDQVMQVASYYMLCGLPVWFVLVLVFHQHRLERIEALEAEEIQRQSGASSSIFEPTDADMSLAARRLRWMYDFLIPLFGVLVAIAMGAVGFWQWRVLSGRLAIQPGMSTDQLEVMERSAAPWALAVTAGLGVGCFIFSRYISGMSRQRAWILLRSGASMTVGTALFCAALAIGSGFHTSGNASVMRILAMVFPWAIMLLGAEIAVNFVLNLYRPRRAGEFHRPAFDSRILSLVAEPDTIARSISDAINYQFGFEVTSTWAYRLVSRQIWVVVAFCVVVLILLNTVSIVRPHEQAIVTSFGRLTRDGEVYNSGIVLKWPWQRVEAYPVHRIQRIRIGKEYTDEDAPILWTRSHTTEPEDLIIVGPMRRGGSTGDGQPQIEDGVARNYAVLNFEVPIQYRIKTGVDETNGEPGLWNYIQFAAGGEFQRAELIRSIATRVITKQAARIRIDDVLGPSRSRLSYELRALLQNELDSRNAGVDVLFVGISGIHPPVDVADSFEQILQARERREAAIEAAEAEATTILAQWAGSEQKALDIAEKIEGLEQLEAEAEDYDERRAEVERLLLSAGGEAANELLRAQAQRWRTHLSAWSNALIQENQLAAYRAAPRLYTVREYLMRVSRALAGARVFVSSPNVETRVTVELYEDPTNVGLIGEVQDFESQFDQ